MKTHLPVKLIFSFVFIMTIVISCSKKDDIIKPIIEAHVSQPSSTSIGEIADSGIVNPGTRVMKMNLNPQYFTLYGYNEQESNAKAKVNVAFYVNNDGQIPPGVYNFSSTDTKVPFTFDSAELAYLPDGNSQTSTTDQVVDGTITVSQHGNNYVFSLSLNLASGMTTSQIYSGVFDYADLNMK
jgi:hypothetical protein